MTRMTIQMRPMNINTAPEQAANISATPPKIPIATPARPPEKAAVNAEPTPRNQLSASKPKPMQKHSIALLERRSGLGASGWLITNDPFRIRGALREAAADQAIRMRDGFARSHADEVRPDLARKQS